MFDSVRRTEREMRGILFDDAANNAKSTPTEKEFG
jgi:hypothetical protein